jgi:hypothetical protein
MSEKKKILVVGKNVDTTALDTDKVLLNVTLDNSQYIAEMTIADFKTLIYSGQGLIDKIAATESTIADFAANSGDYTFEQGDIIALSGSTDLYMYTGGTKTDVGSYSLMEKAFYTGTHAELLALKTADSLVTGKKYVLTDFKTKYNQVVTNTVKEAASFETLILTATSANTFDVRVQSVEFPSDIVEYDITNVLCEDGITARKGKIIYRKDTVNNLTDESQDFRTILNPRWESSTGSGIFNVMTDNGETMQEFLTFGYGNYNCFNAKGCYNVVNGDACFNITNNFNCFNITNGIECTNLRNGANCNNITNEDGCYNILNGDNCNFLINGINCNSLKAEDNSKNVTLPINSRNLDIKSGDYTGLTFGANSTTLLQDATQNKTLYKDATDSFTLLYADNSAFVFVDATT